MNLDLDRLDEAFAVAREYATKGDMKPMDAIPSLMLMITDADVICGECHECKSWNGMSNRCDCGNRRVYWRWKEDCEVWTPEAY